MTTTEQLNKVLSDGKAGAFAVKVPKRETRGSDIFQVSWVGRVDLLALYRTLYSRFGDRVLELNQLTDMTTDDGKPCAGHEIEIAHPPPPVSISTVKPVADQSSSSAASLLRFMCVNLIGLVVCEVARVYYFGSPIHWTTDLPMYGGYACCSLLAWLCAVFVFGTSTWQVRVSSGGGICVFGLLWLAVSYVKHECLVDYKWPHCTQTPPELLPHIWDARSPWPDKVFFFACVTSIQLGMLLVASKRPKAKVS